jgi:hypothetical protein
MIRTLVPLLFLFGLFAGAADAQEVYRWVDEDGTVHFSDRPVEGQEDVEEVNLPKAQTFSAPKTSAPAKKDEPEKPDSVDGYREVDIVKPTSDEVIWNTAGDIEVEVVVIPGLKANHSILLFLDDQMLDGKADGDLTFSLTEIERGTHALHAEVRDASGTALIKSSPINFTVQQQSILNQKNPKNAPLPGTPGPIG